ncbi:hypothetical protein LAUMK35_05676 [Mycobacterium pseudokansasii]|nr:hypothetical protein LAUMK35_05676 [Mycobacterium pseudokansasii]VBA35694.1 hypothetical protein LAUMK21_05659 [Mycobacterium pseudokansasii]
MCSRMLSAQLSVQLTRSLENLRYRDDGDIFDVITYKRHYVKMHMTVRVEGVDPLAWKQTLTRGRAI